VVRDASTGRYGSDAPALPVVTVSLAGAAAYCAWLTRASGVGHRLPGEFEWEKAARGPASCVYASGDVYLRGQANAESGALAPVGRFAANGWGLFDMTGNAFEWTEDRYAPGPDHVLRGGSFVLDGVFLRNSFRMHANPTTRADDFGFRPVRESPPAPDEAKR
jgi:formylglycine-generating enzyme required for sulfatase activity